MRPLRVLLCSIVLVGCNEPTAPRNERPNCKPAVDTGRADPLIRHANYRTLTGKVVSIADGDTLTVLDESNTQHRIRLQGIDTPERKQAFGTKAREALAGKVFQKTVTVKWREKDRYKRTLGHVYVDDRWNNRELVEEGWACHYKRYSKSKELAAAEVKARGKKAGLWADAGPPWEFRRGKRRNSKSKPDESINGNATVYVTRTGRKYHRESC